MERNKKYRDEYTIRTLAYYQRVGGIFNELITILQRIRNSWEDFTLLAPNNILNMACKLFDYINMFCKNQETGKIDSIAFNEVISNFWNNRTENENPNKGYNDKNKEVVLCCLCVLLSEVEPIQHLYDLYIKPLISNKIHNYFKSSIVNQTIATSNKETEELIALLENKEELIKQKDEKLAEQSNQIANLQIMIVELKRKLSTIKDENNSSSRFDATLTLDNILEWIQSRQHYQYTEHVFRMLADLRYRVATDEECDKIRTVENEMLSKNVGNNIINNNIGMGSNFLTGVASHPLMPIGVTPEDMINKFIEFMNHGAGEGNQNREP